MQKNIPIDLDATTRDRVGAVLGNIPQGRYIITATHERREGAVLVSWVQQVSFCPPMVLVALRRGRAIVPLIQESHTFALNQIAEGDALTVRRFARPRPEPARSSRRSEDDEIDYHPLQSIRTLRKRTGSPILAKAMGYMDCEVVRHIDIDGDHDLYIGTVLDADLLADGPPPVHLREDGFEY